MQRAIFSLWEETPEVENFSIECSEKITEINFPSNWGRHRNNNNLVYLAKLGTAKKEVNVEHKIKSKREGQLSHTILLIQKHTFLCLLLGSQILIVLELKKYHWMIKRKWSSLIQTHFIWYLAPPPIKRTLHIAELYYFTAFIKFYA